MTWERRRAGSVRGSLPGISALFLLLGLAFLAGCAATEWSTQDPYPLGEDLRKGFPDIAACFPLPPEGWEVEPMVIHARISTLGTGKIRATLEGREVHGEGKMAIRIYTSPWSHWRVPSSTALERLTFQDRQAGLDRGKDQAELYVLLRSAYVAALEVIHSPEAAQAVVDFASATDFDCLEERLHWQ